MFILKKKLINNFSITDQQLRQIQLELTRGHTKLFQELIVDPLWLTLSNFIYSDYPALEKEVEDILEEVFKRYRKELRKNNSSENPSTVKKNLTALTRAECILALPGTKELQGKNFGLSWQIFKVLLRQLQQGDEALIEQVYLTHFKRCVQYLMYTCSCSYDEAYNCTMDALLEIRKDLIGGKIFYGNLEYYFTTRAKNKWFKQNGKKNGVNQPSNIEGLDFEEEEHIESDIYKRELKDLITEALQKLCGDCKEILRLYYYEDYSLKDIAVSMSKTHDAVRKQATRCRNKLRNHLGETFYQKFSSFFGH